MSTDVMERVSREEIEWVKSKHKGLQGMGKRMLKEAIEIGQWFVEKAEPQGVRQGVKGTWHLWCRAEFPEMPARTIRNYMRLARGQEYLDRNHFGGTAEVMTIEQALSELSKRDREAKEPELDQPPAPFTEPLQILADELKSYVLERFALEYRAEQIRLRIKAERLGRRQIRQAVEWACQNHPEIKDLVLKAFL